MGRRSSLSSKKAGPVKAEGNTPDNPGPKPKDKRKRRRATDTAAPVAVKILKEEVKAESPNIGMEKRKTPKMIRCDKSVTDLVEDTQPRDHGAGADVKACNLPDASAPEVVQATRWRQILDVNGFQTEVFGVHHIKHSPQDKALLQVIIFPGNPGNAGYYLPLLSHIHSYCKGLVDVVAVSHKGHGIGCGCTAAYSLDEQIEHKVDFLLEHCMGKDDPPVVIIGHSIGAYMAFQAAKVIEQSKPADTGEDVHKRLSFSSSLSEAEADEPSIAKVIGVFPFLAMNSKGSPRQRFLKSVCRFPAVVASLGSLIGFIPNPVRQAVLRAIGGSELKEQHSLESTAMLMQFWNCYNAFFLAHTEFEDLAKPPDWDLIRRLDHRASMILCPNDMWAPDWMMEEMKTELPDLEVKHDPHLVHGFCVSDALSRLLAVHIMTQLSSLLGLEELAP